MSLVETLGVPVFTPLPETAEVGLEIPAIWLRQGVTREWVVDGLRPLHERRWSSCSRRTTGRPNAPRSSERSRDCR
jgi:hypothetical protein